MDFGPTHPASAGLLTGVLTLTDGIVTAIDPQPGALHRGAELLFPARDYRQALALANRHDWQAPFFGEWLLARLVESELGVEVPPRAVWVRAILAEHTRVASHLAYLSFVGHHLGRPDLATDEVREELRRRTAELTGNRLHPMIVRLGGVAAEPDAAWADAERATLAQAVRLAASIRDAVASGFGAGIAVVSVHDVNAFGLAGPIARASGVATDLRLSAPEPPYDTAADLLDVDAPTTGNAQARFWRLAEEVASSAALVERFLDTRPQPGALTAHLPQVVKLPVGDSAAAVEAPLGRAEVLVTSRGDRTPWRLRLRTPSFANVSAWPAVIPGVPLAGLTIACASLPWVAGDLDK